MDHRLGNTELRPGSACGGTASCLFYRVGVCVVVAPRNFIRDTDKSFDNRSALYAHQVLVYQSRFIANIVCCLELFTVRMMRILNMNQWNDNTLR